MQTNYQSMLDEIIKQNHNKTPKLLLHSCCAPCSSYVIEYLSNHFEITILYYNPNIEPEEEYKKRKQEQIKFIQNLNNISFLDIDYDNIRYRSNIKDFEDEREGGRRCTICFTTRLSQTAKIGSEKGFEYFGTTLTVSAHKNSQLLNKIGEEQSIKYNIPYLFSDFKKNNGYKRSIELSKKYSLYRQDYCGCLFSKDESEKKHANNN